jgi:hypothetical protein
MVRSRHQAMGGNLSVKWLERPIMRDFHANIEIRAMPFQTR